MFADDVQPRRGQQMVNVGDPASDRVLDRNHGKLGLAVGNGRERVLESRAGQGLVVGPRFRAGDVRVGAPFTLEGDASRHDAALAAMMARARSRSAGVSTPSGTSSTMTASIRMLASSARSCSSF